MKEKSRKLFYIFFGLLTLATITIVVLLFLCLFEDNAIDNTAHIYTPTKQQQELLQGTEVKLPIIDEIRIKQNQDEAEVCFFNPKEQTYYLTYTLYIRGEKVYESKWIKPGKAIEKIKLNQSIPLGSYEAYIEIKSYDIESKMEVHGQRQNVRVEAYEK